MIPILYDSGETAFISNGLCRLRDCLSMTCSEERNGIYELDFEYPVDGANFELIQPGRIVYATHDDSGLPQPFDIVSYSKPISGIVTFHAVHISYRQSALTVYGTGVNSLEDALTLLGTAQPSNPFTYSADFTSTAFLAAADGVPRSVRQMLGGIDGSILDAYGGEYEFDHFNVILHNARGSLRDFTIRYGLNLLDYNDETDYSGSYSSCVPYWVGIDDDGNDVVQVATRVDSGLAMYNGRNDCIPLDLTEKFEDKPTKTALRNMAASIMSAQQVNLPAQTITVDFVRLQDMGEFADFQALLQCNLCDTIKVVFPRYNMYGTFKIVKTVYNVLQDRYESMELGALSTSLAEALGISEKAETRARINDLSIGGDLAVGGDANITGEIVPNAGITLQNAAQNGIRIKDTNGDPYNMVYITNPSNYFNLGYGTYNQNIGETRIYGDTLRLYSHNPIAISQPLAALYKTTTVEVEVGAISAHGYESATGHTMTAQSGYEAVAISGWTTSNYRIRPTTHRIDSNTSIFAGFANTSTSNVAAGTTITFRVLWLKGTSA